MKLKSQTRDMKPATIRYRSPDEAKKQEFNSEVSTKYRQYCEDYPHEDKMVNLAWAVKLAAENNLEQIHEQQNYEYISADTWNKIKERDEARLNLDALNKEIKKGTRKDEKAWRIKMLETWSDPRTNWKQIKREKQDYKANYYGMKDIEGNRVPHQQKNGGNSRIPTEETVGTQR